MKIRGLIDEPTPYAPLEEWEAFARRLRSMKKDDAVRETLERAERIIAEKKAETGAAA